MATAKSAGAAKYGRDSNPKYLGVKLHDGGKARIGNIIIRQRGAKYRPGTNVKKGADDTIYAIKDGLVKFITRYKKGFNGRRRITKIVNIVTA